MKYRFGKPKPMSSIDYKVNWRATISYSGEERYPSGLDKLKLYLRGGYSEIAGKIEPDLLKEVANRS